MKTFWAGFLGFLLWAGCTYQVNIDPEKYFPCKSDGSCPEGCTCLGEKACVPNELGKDPSICEWCPEGRANCDGVIGNGCEVDLNTDVNNCGKCSKFCILAQASAACVNGQCVVSTCKEGFADCDGNPANGCESKLATDRRNCGRCGNDCGELVRKCNEDGDIVVSGRFCQNGMCVERTVVVDCLSGCQTGSCICQQGYCIGGPCGRSYCRAGEICVKPEIGLCVCGRVNEYASCARDERCCDGVCVKMSEGHCLGCGVDCGINTVCKPDGLGDASCVCPEGFADCNSDLSDGCETDIRVEGNCGGCGVVCPANSACTISGNLGVCQCKEGFFDCNGNLDQPRSDGCESQLIDNNNCGACGYACGKNSQCVGSSASEAACVCNRGFQDCNGERVDGCEVYVDSDVYNCGSCGNVCLQGAKCILGNCTTPGIVCPGVTQPCPLGEKCCWYGLNQSHCSEGYESCSGFSLYCDDKNDCASTGPAAEKECCALASRTICTELGTCNGLLVCKSDADCPATKKCCPYNFGGLIVYVCQEC